MAMVIALIVSMVLLTLATVIVAQSVHDAESSGMDRRRLQSVNAAEAGNNYYYAYLQSTTVATLNCQPVTQTIATAPATASFTATPTFYDATGTVMPCSSATPFTSTYYPSSVAITTTGSVTGQSPRTMQTFIRLTPVYGGFGQAILSQSGATFPNNFDVYGNNGSHAEAPEHQDDHDKMRDSVEERRQDRGARIEQPSVLEEPEGAVREDQVRTEVEAVVRRHRESCSPRFVDAWPHGKVPRRERDARTVW